VVPVVRVVELGFRPVVEANDDVALVDSGGDPVVDWLPVVKVVELGFRPVVEVSVDDEGAPLVKPVVDVRPVEFS